MPLSRPALLTSALALSLCGGVAAVAQTSGTLIMRSRTVVRVAPPSRPVPDTELKWDESKANKCQPLGDIAAAVATGERHMDLLMRNRTRIRARFKRGCRGDDFYAGFYVEPSQDGMLCANRDSVRARTGMTCRIDRFRRLTLDR